MKHLLYGIALMFFGFCVTCIAVLTELPALDIIGLLTILMGFIMSTYGFASMDK